MYVMTLSLHVANLTRYKITFIDECVVHTGRSKPPSTRNSNNLHAQRLYLEFSEAILNPVLKISEVE